MRVLLFAEPSMFNEGIEAMLRQEPGLEIVGREEDPEEAVKLIEEASPDVILVADGEAAAVLAPELMRMVRQGFRMRMVEVHLATNTLCIYRGEQQRVREAGELLEAVRHTWEGLTGDPQSPLTPVLGADAA
jgi:DNA-binding NarL/FixJ family response regulator